MTPDISEFSYAYALTETLIKSSMFRAAPIFPSLIDEGKPGGGYDVEIPFDGFPLFLQFKLSHKMVRNSAWEAQLGLLTTPFYRMHLRSTKYSQQHPMLLALEASPAAVYYAAPCFDTPEELNQAYINGAVATRSVFFRPSENGTLPDDGDHHVAFKNGNLAYLCSENPRKVTGRNHKKFFADLAEQHGQYNKISREEEESIRSWNERLIDIIEEHLHFRWDDNNMANARRNRSPVKTLAYLARTFFDCNVLLVAPPKTGSEDIAG